jgi:2-polyprenyl-3-methyl-5-hydroxy-6-metoxy-1,4-benzoquinol methylase
MGWFDLYNNEISKYDNLKSYVDSKIGYKRPFIELIKKYNTTGKLLEAGSGTGTLSTYLATEGFDVTGMDIDDGMLEIAKKIGEEYNKEKKAKFIKVSIFDLDYKENEFSICFSNGVLEHFSNEKIIETLEKQLKISETVIFGIPTRYFTKEEAMYGDERYLPSAKWIKLIKASGGEIVEEAPMNYLGAKSRIRSIKKWFKPRPFRIFVVRKDT